MFDRCLFFNINSLTRMINKIWEQAYAGFDLSPSHAYLIRTVSASPGMTPKQLADTLSLEKSTISRFLDVLEGKGYISRKKDSHGDARILGIFLTIQGQRIAGQLDETGQALYKQMKKSLGTDMFESLVSQLKDSREIINQSDDSHQNKRKVR